MAAFRHIKLFAALAIVSATVACGDNRASYDAGTADSDPRDILSRLKAVPGLIVDELNTEVPGYRAFALGFDQPVDHAKPSQRFVQHATLLHRDTTAPLIVATTGYWDYIRDRRVELTRLVAGNQISIEHRFFGASRPDPADWTQLTVRNAAADQHQIIAALRTIYVGNVATTGASKGGMTAIYHRRFYPDDVDASFPYVAPQSLSDQDPRYMQFLASVGPAPCRNALRDLQVELLSRRRAMLQQRASEQASQQGLQYTRIALPAAVEASVAALDWAFWQYRGVADCDGVPMITATDDAVWQFVDQVAPVSDNSDDTTAAFEAYYYQAAFELGQPTMQATHLVGLYQFSDVDYIGLLPLGVAAPSYTVSAMQDIGQWLQQSAQRMMLIYGQWDPWTAGAFTLGNAQDSFQFTQPQGTHGANLLGLAPADRATAATKIGQWLGMTPVGLTVMTKSEAFMLPPRLPSALVHVRHLAAAHRGELDPVVKHSP
ncbi:MAG: multidrug transporter [Kofleriaceae bacterium]|nr:multidrug transporter [Kofleriaceae bacterium]